MDRPDRPDRMDRGDRRDRPDRPGRPERPERPKPPMKMLGKKLGRLEIFTSGKCPKRPEVDSEPRMWKQRN